MWLGKIHIILSTRKLHTHLEECRILRRISYISVSHSYCGMNSCVLLKLKYLTPGTSLMVHNCIMVRRCVSTKDPGSCASSSIATGRTSMADRSKGRCQTERATLFLQVGVMQKVCSLPCKRPVTCQLQNRMCRTDLWY
jgi:hypothetical protein